MNVSTLKSDTHHWLFHRPSLFFVQKIPSGLERVATAKTIPSLGIPMEENQMEKKLQVAISLAIFLMVVFSLTAIALSGEHGINRVLSPYSVETTADRFETAVREKGLKVFSRYDHAGAATEFDLELRPIITLAFGNPKYGTPFMAIEPTAGIDFPPKAVVYEDNEGKVWLAYNTADYLYNTIFKRHKLQFPEEHITFFEGVLEDLVAKAIAEE